GRAGDSAPNGTPALPGRPLEPSGRPLVAPFGTCPFAVRARQDVRSLGPPMHLQAEPLASRPHPPPPQARSAVLPCAAASARCRRRQSRIWCPCTEFAFLPT